MFYNNGYNQDWSTLKKLIWLRGNPATGQMGTDLTVSGTPPLSLPNSLGKPLKAWSVDVLPYQEGTGDPSPDNVRPIHGTDKVTIYTDSKYGGLVEWNQFIPNTNANKTVNGITYTNNRDGSWTVRGTATGGTAYYNLASAASHAGHKVLFWYGVKSVNNIYRIGDFNNGNTITYTSDAVIVVGSQANIVIGVQVYDTKTIDITFSPMAFDLTQMFGAGNEPSTVAEFRALFPNDYYAYNAGQQMTVDQVNGAQYSPAVLTLSQTVYTGTIGSEGGESRWGEVDLGTLNWIYTPSSLRFSTTDLRNSIKYTYGINNYNMACSIYKPASYGDYIIWGGWMGDVNVCNSQYTSASDFKTAMSGVKLYYELATPATFAVPSVTIPTPTGTATTWATAEDGTVDSMEVTYVGKA